MANENGTLISVKKAFQEMISYIANLVRGSENKMPPKAKGLRELFSYVIGLWGEKEFTEI